MIARLWSRARPRAGRGVSAILSSIRLLGVSGWVRNVMTAAWKFMRWGRRSSILNWRGYLWKGPRWAEVRGVDENEAVVESHSGFSVRQ